VGHVKQTLLELAVAALLLLGSAFLFLEHKTAVGGVMVAPSTGVLVSAPPLPPPCEEDIVFNEEEGVPDDGWLAEEF